MHFSYLKCPRFPSRIEYCLPKGMEKETPIRFDFFLRVYRYELRKKGIQLIAVPPSVHVGLPKTQTSFPHYPLVKPLILDPDIPRHVSVKGDAGLRKYSLDSSLVLICGPRLFARVPILR